MPANGSTALNWLMVALQGKPLRLSLTTDAAQRTSDGNDGRDLLKEQIVTVATAERVNMQRMIGACHPRGALVGVQLHDWPFALCQLSSVAFAKSPSQLVQTPDDSMIGEQAVHLYDIRSSIAS